MEEPPSYHSISVENRSGLFFDSSSIQSAVEVCLNIADASPFDIRIQITSDEHVRNLNRNFRRVDEETDVLTFADAEGYSGDIAIAGPYAQRQARLRLVDLTDELRWLAIHGTLHLLGQDDESLEDRQTMFARMAEVGDRLGMCPVGDWSSLLHEEAPV